MSRASEPEPSLTTRLASWSARHGWRVVLAWIALVVIAVVVAQAFPADTDLDQQAPGESGEAFQLFEQRFGIDQGEAQEILVFSHPALTVDDPKYRQTVSDALAQLLALRAVDSSEPEGTRLVSSTRIVSSTLSHYDIGAPREQSPFVSRNQSGGDVTFALVNMEGDISEAEEHVDAVIDAVQEAQERSPEFEILVGGDASVQKQASEIIEEDFGFALFLNLPVTLVILILAFGALLAAVVPLVLAFAAIIVATGVLALVSQVYPLSEIYSEMVLLMGLATGIDYSLFVLSRYRGERRAGLAKEDALARAFATSGKAVVFAGATVILAIAGMFLVNDAIFTSLGLAAIVVVAMAVLSSVTLLPALLGLMGDNVNRLTIPLLGRPAKEGGGVWGYISDHVLSRPAVLASITLVALLALAVPLLTLNLGFNGAKALSDDVEAKKALLALERDFTLGLTSPAMVVVDAGEDGNIFAQNVQSHVAELTGLVEAETVSRERPSAPYGAPLQTEINNAGNTELVQIPVNADTGEDRAIDAVNHLRDNLIPGAFANSPARALVTGATAANIDFRENIILRTPFVFAFVLGLAFTILLVTFRSIVIAVKAIVLNLLSVGAAYGLLVLVFQEGWFLEGVLNFEATGIIESWLPLFLFSILFGLSMDYHMFIMGRIKEAHERGASNDDAIATGVKATAGTITNAALIMVAVAIIFAFTRSIGLKQFGFGLAAAIFIDATVIRSILLPASMKLLGEANWYLPRWLEWLPRVRMAE